MSKVSVIIPYFNNEKTLERALESVSNQTYKNLEIILINDGSSDNSRNVVKEFINNNSSKFEIIHIEQENKGPSAARNKGINLASGNFIAFLDADDSWKSEKIEYQIDILKKHKDIFILGTDYELNYEGKIITKSINDKKIKYITFEKRLLKNYFNTPSVIIKREVFTEENLYFDENQRYAEDTLLYLKILRNHNGAKICMPLITLYKPEISKQGLSSNIIKTEKYELLNYHKLYKENDNNIKKINLFKLIFLDIFSFLKFLRRIIIIECR